MLKIMCVITCLNIQFYVINILFLYMMNLKLFMYTKNNFIFYFFSKFYRHKCLYYCEPRLPFSKKFYRF